MSSNMRNSQEKLSLKPDNPTNKISIETYGSLDYEDYSDGMQCIDAELSRMTLKKIEIATKISLVINIILFIIKMAVFFDTGSFAVVAALTDSFCDLVSQAILFYTQKAVRKPKKTFPAGRTRLEPVGILIMSILMIILSCSVVFGSAFTLYSMYGLKSNFTVGYSLWSVLLLVVSIILKFCLWIYCKRFTSSPSAMALAEDHRNDVLSNGTALIAVCIASQFHNAVWTDPVGGLLISLYIIWSWYTIGIEESNKLIGIIGDEEDMEKLHAFIKKQLSMSEGDYLLNGHYIGRNMLVELRIIYEKCTDYKKLCDLGMMLQRKLESFTFVERAFVAFDYIKREEDIHKIPILE